MATLNLRTVANGSVILSPTSTATDKTITLPATDGTMVVQDSSNITSVTNLAYTGTLTGGTGVINIGSGQVYKAADGKVGIGSIAPSSKFQVDGTTSINGSNATYTGTIQINESVASAQAIGGLEFKSASFGSGYGWKIASLDSSGAQLTFNSRQNSATWSENMRLDSSGNLGLGVTPSAWSSSFKVFQANTASLAAFGNNNINLGYNNYFDGTNSRYITTNAASYYQQQAGAHAWFTAPSGTAGNAITFTERMRIGADGFTNVFVTANDGFTSRNSVAAGTSNALYLGYHSATGTTNGTLCYVVWSNGNVVNTNNSYGAYSDIKLKENIVPASPKLDKLMQVEVVNYNLKDSPDQKLLGVVAQQLEQVFPSLVEESPDRDEEGNDLGTTTKSVKYSVFVPMLIKAVQELTARLEVLENK